MILERNVISRASALGWKSQHLGDEVDADAAFDWLCDRVGELELERDAAQKREKLLRESLRVANDLLKGLDCVTVDLVPEAKPVGAGPNER